MAHLANAVDADKIGAGGSDLSNAQTTTTVSAPVVYGGTYFGEAPGNGAPYTLSPGGEDQAISSQQQYFQRTILIVAIGLAVVLGCILIVR